MTRKTAPEALAKPGRPLAFETPEAMHQKVDGYFIPENEPFSVTGLCNWLNITRATFGNYRAKPEFSDMLTVAKQKIEENLLKRGLNKQSDSQLTRFVLKNCHNYRDQQEPAVTDQVFEIEW